ncbi:protein phosphatase 2C domain-containing protein [Nakamurella multipartita]|uniref:PPM-type phosphatase domain-containing protein n=1 Tax=Nakamurella multipartita (strain ATCC 700099 / DSM 44233 / CIP 104796 / JCM 9543 / NBRC 105858 / Y-104) TaxID=479431 RepID=C8XHE8_NAKMY|nr:protein phosphatase 2C domain-containing protein [Nakamurella multipartita]ACV78354.1 hypothetical protein Namu_1967 [Nakamurella multipartita DSM 44233]
MLEFRVATDPGSPDKPNEDAFAILPRLAVVADGATSPPHLGDGCIHGPAWYARTLVGFVASAHLSRPVAEPADLLVEAIERTTQAHSGTCDVGHPGSPSATVAMLTVSTEGIARWLVLGDCTFVADAGPDLLVVSDDRLANTSHSERAAVKEPGVASDPVEYGRRDALVLAQRSNRNRSGGFWAASSCPRGRIRIIRRVDDDQRKFQHADRIVDRWGQPNRRSLWHPYLAVSTRDDRLNRTRGIAQATQACRGF